MSHTDTQTRWTRGRQEEACAQEVSRFLGARVMCAMFAASDMRPPPARRRSDQLPVYTTTTPRKRTVDRTKSIDVILLTGAAALRVRGTG